MKACRFGSNEMNFEVYESKFKVRGSASQKHDSGQFYIKTFANNSGELADEFKKKLKKEGKNKLPSMRVIITGVSDHFDNEMK